MASIRDLKKEIDSRIYELLSDCFVFSELHHEKESQDVSGIIADAVSLRNDLVHRVNHPGFESGTKELNAHYRSVKNDLDSGTEKLFEELSSLSKKKKK